MILGTSSVAQGTLERSPSSTTTLRPGRDGLWGDLSPPRPPLVGRGRSWDALRPPRPPPGLAVGGLRGAPWPHDLLGDPPRTSRRSYRTSWAVLEALSGSSAGSPGRSGWTFRLIQEDYSGALGLGRYRASLERMNRKT